jgi:Type II secretion system (T2SS), protein M subtype b
MISLSAYYERMNRRERLLAGAVILVLFLFINVFIWSALLGGVKSARAELTERKAVRKTQTVFLRERDVWKKRQDWLAKHQPILQNAGEASTLLEQVKQIAGKHKVLIENPSLGAVQSAGDHQSIAVSLETKSPWPALVHFLYDVQQPEAFIAFEDASLSIDGTDPSTMRGRFRIARWFAPTQHR